MSIIQPSLTLQQKTEITDYINVYRAKHQAPPLMWDDTIAVFSQNWSYYLISNNVFKHSNTSLYGENLAFFQGYGTDTMMLLKKSIDAWYNEVSLYDFNNPGFSAATGHFTCLVWKSSTKYGMGITINSKTNGVDITMNTSPPGNYVGEFIQNVLPALPVPVPNPVPNPVPVPVPVPNPVPVPVPVPNPVPVPSPNPINVIKILNMLYKINYDIQTDRSKYYTISDVYAVISEINNTEIQPLIKTKLVNSLYNIIYAINKNKKKAIIASLLVQIINDIISYTQ